MSYMWTQDTLEKGLLLFHANDSRSHLWPATIKVMSKEDKVRFILNSGALDHITNRSDLFINYTILNPAISVAKHGVFIYSSYQKRNNASHGRGRHRLLEDISANKEPKYVRWLNLHKGWVFEQFDCSRLCCICQCGCSFLRFPFI